MNFLRDYVFWAGWAKIEGRRHADPEVKSAPGVGGSATCSAGSAVRGM